MNALSVDVEEYYHGMEFEAAVPVDQRGALPSRVEESVDRVLDLMSRSGRRGTFFTVGAVAEAHPAMVTRIAAAGHEVACHSYAHTLVWRQSPGEFRADLRMAKGILEDLSGQAVIGYRAPNYSIGRNNAWAFDILLEEGFRYDSSIYPIAHDRYGHPGAPRFPHRVTQTGGDGLIEFPIGTARFLGTSLPIGGGGYFRLFPYALICAGIEAVNRGEGRPVIFYFHPWELDPDHPRPPMPLHHRLRHYLNLARVEAKLERLLAEFRFAPVRDVLAIEERLPCFDLTLS